MSKPKMPKSCENCSHVEVCETYHRAYECIYDFYKKNTSSRYWSENGVLEQEPHRILRKHMMRGVGNVCIFYEYVNHYLHKE